MNRELVLLARTADARTDPSGMYLSTKLDGQRVLWDGGISRGMDKKEIPWANTDRDERYVRTQFCTGLWTRYGNVVHAPASFLDTLPLGVFLDGELYLGRGKFQETRKIISTLEPGPGWSKINYHIFDMPSPTMLFTTGKINNPNFTKYIHEETCLDILRRKVTTPDLKVRSYKDTLKLLDSLGSGPQWTVHPQVLLPQNEERAKRIVEDSLVLETSLGGEGLMLRSASSVWHPKRSKDLLKVKRLDTDEGVVTGYYSGIGKLAGRFGALEIAWKGQRFQLSGFTDEERTFSTPEARTWALQNEGKRCPDWCQGKHFPSGSTIRFTYMTLTDMGLPREARYCR